MPAKRKAETLESLLARPWCYYCDRDFDDDKNLVDHQKAKHFMCTVNSCRRRLNTVGGLAVHMQQVHKEELQDVPNALPERNNLKLEIFASYGIPEDLNKARTDYVLKQFHHYETEFFKKTGNPLPGSGRTHVPKKPKMEDKESLKARVAEAKAKLAAKKAAAAAGLPDPTETSSPTPPAVQASSESPYPAAQASGPPGMAASPPPGMYFGPPQPPPVSSPMQYQTIPGFPMPAHTGPYGFPGQAPSYITFAPPPQVSTPMHAYQASNNGWQPSLPYSGNNHIVPSSLPPIPQAPQSNAALDSLINGVFESGGMVPAEYQAAADKQVRGETTEEPALESVKESLTKPVQKGPTEEPALEPGKSDVANHIVPPKPAATLIRAAKGEHQLLTDNRVSWEEKRAQSGRYQIKPKSSFSHMPTQTATQGVSGAVDESLGNEMS